MRKITTTVQDFKFEELSQRIAEELQILQKRHLYSISASVKQRGHYQHEMCTAIGVDWDHGDSAEDETKEILRDFMRWIYKELKENYESLTSKEEIIETIKSNGYEFTEEGEIV